MQNNNGLYDKWASKDNTNIPTWSPWDNPSVSNNQENSNQSHQTQSSTESFFDPFGSFQTEPNLIPVSADHISNTSQPITSSIVKTTPIVNNNPFGALMNDFAPPSQPTTLQTQIQPQPSSQTQMNFSNDFMDLLGIAPKTTEETKASGITTALDDFFGTPPPQVEKKEEKESNPNQSNDQISNQENSSEPIKAQTPNDSESIKSENFKKRKEGLKMMTITEKEEEDELLRSLELRGPLEKLSQGLLGESWKPKWVTFKANRFAYYEQKTDPRPKYYVYLDETEVGLPKVMSQSYDYHHAFQLVNERKGTNWYFRTQGTADLKKWTQNLSASSKHFQSLNSVTTIYERILLLSCVRYRSIEHYRSFSFYTSKQSTGSYAIAACILIELLLRHCIDITVNENIILHSETRYQGLGILDDTLDLLSQKLRMQREVRLAEFLPMLLCSGSFVFGDLSLEAPVLRCIDSSVRRGSLKRGQTAKDWHVANLELEDDLIKKFHSLSKEPYDGTDPREHATLGICYTVTRALNKTDLPVQQVLDRGKVFPDLQIRQQLDPALDSMAKNLGPFDKKQSIILKTMYSQLVQFITGGGQYLPQQASR